MAVQLLLACSVISCIRFTNDNAFKQSVENVSVGRRAIEYVLEQRNLVNPKGLFLEFGVHDGTTLQMISNRFSNSDVHGFDSFLGLPERWRTNSRLPWLDSYVRQGAFSLGGIPPSGLNKNVQLHIGLFQQTLRPFLRKHNRSFVSFVHIDSDTYSAARFVLQSLWRHLHVGTIIIFDELVNYKDFEQHEFLAAHEVLDVVACLVPIAFKGPTVHMNDQELFEHDQGVAFRVEGLLR
jgi:hypothetical protein